MNGIVFQFKDPRVEAARQTLECDMVAEVERRWAEALRDVADLGGVSVDHLKALVLVAAARRADA